MLLKRSGFAAGIESLVHKKTSPESSAKSPRRAAIFQMASFSKFSKFGYMRKMFNLCLFFLLAITFYQVTFPPMGQVVGTMMIGFFAYGLSLTLFVVGLRHLGTARTGAYFSIAPFVGAVIAVLMGEAITVPLLIAGVLMGFGVWLHLTEKHEHIHRHEALEHEHEHIHDEHHQHSHDYPVAAGVKHCHRHQHQLLEHSHPHYPDIHHQHKH